MQLSYTMLMSIGRLLLKVSAPEYSIQRELYGLFIQIGGSAIDTEEGASLIRWTEISAGGSDDL